MRDFTGKRVIVTGGSRGIGYAAADAFVQAGARVLITGRSAETLAAAADKLGNGTAFLEWDMTDVYAIPEKLEQAVRLLGGLDVLICNAGVLERPGGDRNAANDFFRVSPEDWDYIMNVNLRSVFFLCQAAANRWIARGEGGHIVNVCSNMGFRMVSTAPYGIGKWGVRGMTLGLGQLLARQGIIVNAVSPGPVTTQMMGWKEGDENVHPHIPIGRYSTPEEVAETVLFLAGSETVVGEALVADGGERLY